MPPFNRPDLPAALVRGWDVAVAWLRALRRSRRRDDERLQDDLAFHLEQAVAEARDRGLSPEAARVAAIGALGSPARVRAEVRELSPWTAVERLLQDARYGVRGFGRAPAFTATIVLSLGVAIGANAAIFAVVDAFVLRKLPVHDPDALFTLRRQGTSAAAGPGRAFELSYAQYLALRERLPHLSQVAARGGRLDRYNITASGPGGGLDPQQAWLEPVSGNYFAVLGLRPSRGRLIGVDDDRAPGASPVAVISDDYWRRRFASAPDVVGRTLSWNGATFVIVGVGPDGFTGLTTGVVTDIWVPLTMQPQAIPEAARFLTSDARWLQLVVRAPPDVAPGTAGLATDAAWQQVERDRGTSPAPRLELASLAHGFQGPRAAFAQPLTIVLAAMLLVLLVACVTVANLVSARALARAREFAVRRALGAGSGRLVRQVLTESALLGGAAGALGLLLGIVSGAAVPHLLDVDLLSRGARLDVRLDARLLAFVGTLSALAIAIVGVAPVLRTARAAVAAPLAGGRSSVDDREGSRMRRALIVAQIALSLVLLTGGGLFLRTLTNLGAIDLGGGARETLVVWTRPGQTALDPPAVAALYDRAASALRALPGVAAASVSYGALFPNAPAGSAIVAIESAADGPPVAALWRYAGSGFAEAIDVPLIAGRDLADADGASPRAVAIVNRALARQLFGRDDPLGRRFRFASTREPIEIVGVMGDTPFESPREAPRPTFYLPHGKAAGSPGGIVWLAVRATGDQQALAAQIRRTLRDVSPHLAVLSIERAGDALDRANGQERLLATTASLFAAVAIALTGVGLYGIVAYTTARRTREIGLRLALGATRGRVVGAVLRESVLLVLGGTAIGIPLAVGAASLLVNRLHGVEPEDPSTLATAAAAMLALAVVAALIPAHRASRTDPTVALRSE